MVKVGINGFGRVGRCAFKVAFDRSDIEIVGINDIFPVDVLAHLLKYDSVFGPYEREVRVEGDIIRVDGKAIKVFNSKSPAEIPWDEVEAEIVVEASGVFRKGDEAAKHIKGSVKKVIITAPAKGPDMTLVLGANEDKYDPMKHNIISNASCTTNCFAMLVKVLHENFKIVRGEMTTIHSYTNDQRILDAPHKDLRRARAAAMSIIPTSTGAAQAIYSIFPELEGKLTALAIRVPTPNVSVCDFSCEVENTTSLEEVNTKFKEYAEVPLKGLLRYTEDPIVSTDIIKDHHSAILDASLTSVVDGKLVKVFGWYDNEWGYSARVVDLIEFIARKGL